MANESRFSLFSAIALLACAAACTDTKDSDEMSIKDWPEQRVVIDDDVIDAGDPWEVIDPVYWTANIYDGVAEYEASLEPFSDKQRLVLAVIWYRSEVNNGGHDQFFYNSTGIVWKDAVRAFRQIGLPRFSEIIEESGRRLGGEPSPDRSARFAQLEENDANFDDLDSRFYELEDRESVDDALIRYINKHRSDFYFDGIVRKPQSPGN